MRISLRPLVATAFALALAACADDTTSASKDSTADAAAPRTPPIAVAPAAPTVDAPTRENPRAPTTFACADGRTVDIGDLVAVVTTKDGRTVQIARDPDNAFRFQGEALAFRMGNGTGELTQDQVATVACTAG